MASKFILFAVGNNSSPSAEKQEKRYDYETGSSHPFKYNSPIHLPVRQVRVLFQLQCKYTIQPIVLLPPARTHPPPHSLNTHICWWLLGVPGTISTVTSSSHRLLPCEIPGQRHHPVAVVAPLLSQRIIIITRLGVVLVRMKRGIWEQLNIDQKYERTSPWLDMLHLLFRLIHSNPPL